MKRSIHCNETVDVIMCMHAMRRDVHMQHVIMQHVGMRSQHRCLHVSRATDRLDIKLKIEEIFDDEVEA